jgi:hypothetical protein
MSTTAGFPNTKPLSSSLVHLSTLAPNSFSAISFTAFLKDSSLNPFPADQGSAPLALKIFYCEEFKGFSKFERTLS